MYLKKKKKNGEGKREKRARDHRNNIFMWIYK